MTIGKLIDDAMVQIEKANPSLKGVLPRDYARPALDKEKLGETHRPDRHHGECRCIVGGGRAYRCGNVC